MMSISTVFSIFLLFSSAILACLFAFLGSNPPKTLPLPIKNYYITAWFFLVLTFITFQSVILKRSKKNNMKKKKNDIILNNAYFVILAICSLEAAASWDVYGRGDVSIVCILCIAASIYNVYLLSTSNKDSHR